MAMQGKAMAGYALKRRAWVAGLIAAALILLAAPSWAEQPQPWGIGMLPSASPVRDRMDVFHTELLVIIFLIAALVCGLLLYVIMRFNARANPVPGKFAHNTTIEIIWTVIPVIILFIIGIPSMQLLYYSDKAVKPDMTIKVTGRQWYWSYEYPDHGNIAVDARAIWDGPGTNERQVADLLREASPKWLIPTNPPLRMLETDNRLVLPVGATVRVLITGSDVIHAWYLPALGVQKSAVPGRLNETWLKIDREGVYYGQCTQICGTGHGYMPIVVEAVSPDRFKTWVQAKQMTTGAIEISTPPDMRLATGAPPQR